MSLRDALKIPASQITDESVYRERRRLLQAFTMAPALTLAGCAEAEPPDHNDPTNPLYFGTTLIYPNLGTPVARSKR